MTGSNGKSTTAAIAAAILKAAGRTTWLLAGGRGKGIGFHNLTAAIGGSARGAAFYGAVGEELYRRQITDSRAPDPTVCETMDEALAWCWQHSRPADAIVLSPACSSHDQCQNFRERGERFSRLVRALSS